MNGDPIEGIGRKFFRAWSYWFPVSFLGLAILMYFALFASHGDTFAYILVPLILLLIATGTYAWVRSKREAVLTLGGIQRGAVEALVLSVTLAIGYHFVSTGYKAVPSPLSIGIWFFLGTFPVSCFQKKMREPKV